MKKVIIYKNKQLTKIYKIRKKGNSFYYFNSLLNLFKQILSKNFIDLFVNSINSSKIISNSDIYKETKINLDIKKLN